MLCSACDPVMPSEIGDWSSTLSLSAMRSRIGSGHGSARAAHAGRGRRVLRGAALARRPLVGVGLLPARRVRDRRRTAREEEVLEVEGQPSGLGWLPDGSLLVVSMRDHTLLRRAPDGDGDACTPT